MLYILYNTWIGKIWKHLLHLTCLRVYANPDMSWNPGFPFQRVDGCREGGRQANGRRPTLGDGCRKHGQKRQSVLHAYGPCVLRPPIQTEKQGRKLEMVFKWRDICVKNITMMSLMAGLVMQGILIWRGLKLQGPPYISVLQQCSTRPLSNAFAQLLVYGCCACTVNTDFHFKATWYDLVYASMLYV